MLDEANLARFGIFALVFAAVALAEAMLPARPRTELRRHHWPRNLALMGIGTAAALLTAPLVALAAAFYAEAIGFGLFIWLHWPAWLEIAISIAILDLVLYGQHRLLHRSPLLWRLHRAHHSDRDLDVSTGLRFHPGEILLSMGVKTAAVLLIGAAPLAVILFAIILNAGALFSHGNIALPATAERRLRRVIVTPDMHRIHHSEDGAEQNSNFGFGLSLWDRLFGSYRARAARPDFTIGLKTRRTRDQLGLFALLMDPARKESNEDTPPHAPRQIRLVQSRTQRPRASAQ